VYVLPCNPRDACITNYCVFVLRQKQFDNLQSDSSGKSASLDGSPLQEGLRVVARHEQYDRWKFTLSEPKTKLAGACMPARCWTPLHDLQVAVSHDGCMMVA